MLKFLLCLHQRKMQVKLFEVLGTIVYWSQKDKNDIINKNLKN